MPDTQENLAKLMLESGIIENNGIDQYLYDIAIPVADSPEKKQLKAVRATRIASMFFTGRYKPLEGSLQ